MGNIGKVSVLSSLSPVHGLDLEPCLPLALRGRVGRGRARSRACPREDGRPGRRATPGSRAMRPGRPARRGWSKPPCRSSSSPPAARASGAVRMRLSSGWVRLIGGRRIVFGKSGTWQGAAAGSTEKPPAWQLSATVAQGSPQRFRIVDDSAAGSRVLVAQRYCATAASLPCCRSRGTFRSIQVTIRSRLSASSCTSSCPSSSRSTSRLAAAPCDRGGSTPGRPCGPIGCTNGRRFS